MFHLGARHAIMVSIQWNVTARPYYSAQSLAVYLCVTLESLHVCCPISTSKFDLSRELSFNSEHRLRVWVLPNSLCNIRIDWGQRFATEAAISIEPFEEILRSRYASLGDGIIGTSDDTL